MKTSLSIHKTENRSQELSYITMWMYQFSLLLLLPIVKDLQGVGKLDTIVLQFTNPRDCSETVFHLLLRYREVMAGK